MFAYRFLSLLLLLTPPINAVPMNIDGQHRMHREHSQELDESIEWDSLQPLIDLPSTEQNHQAGLSPAHVSEHITYNTPAQTAAKKTPRSRAPGPMTELEKEAWRKERRKESQRKYQESLKLNPEKREARNKKKSFARREQYRKYNEQKPLAERKAIRLRRYNKFKEDVQKRGTITTSLHARRILINKVESGTATEYDKVKLGKMRDRDREYHQKKKRLKKQQSGQFSLNNSNSLT